MKMKLIKNKKNICSKNYNKRYLEKKEEIWLCPMIKAPTPTEKNLPPKSLIKQRLRTD